MIHPKIYQTLTSVKFWTLIAMQCVILAEGWGYIEPATAIKMELALAGYMGSKAVEDHGKAAAKTPFTE